MLLISFDFSKPSADAPRSSPQYRAQIQTTTSSALLQFAQPSAQLATPSHTLEPAHYSTGRPPPGPVRHRPVHLMAGSCTAGSPSHTDPAPARPPTDPAQQPRPSQRRPTPKNPSHSEKVIIFIIQIIHIMTIILIIHIMYIKRIISIIRMILIIRIMLIIHIILIIL